MQRPRGEECDYVGGLKAGPVVGAWREIQGRTTVLRGKLGPE